MQKRAYVPNQAEMDQLLERHHQPRVRLALMLSHLAGCRVFEVAQMKIGDVLHSDGSVKNAVHIHGKGDAWRSVPLSEALKGFILAALPPNYQMEWPLVPSRGNKHFNASALCTWLRFRYEEAGIMNATGNSGRRGFMTRMHRKKVPIKIISTLAGHKSLHVTAAYIDVSDDELVEAVSMLG